MIKTVKCQIGGLVGQRIDKSVKREKRGFTLVELLLSMGILTILMTILMRVFVSVVEMRLTAQANSALAQDMKYIYSRMAYDVSRTTSITGPAQAGDSSTSLSLLIGGVLYQYSVDGNQDLILSSQGNNWKLNGSGTKVENVQFVRYGGTKGQQTVKFVISARSSVETVRGAITKQLRGTLGDREI